jgi:hypothetical protein
MIDKPHARMVNMFSGPGTGKSTACAALFSELKYRGHNVEMALEYAKGNAWEKRGEKFWKTQEYIFGHQAWAVRKLVGDVEYIITDCPALMGLVYIPDDFYLPSLLQTIRESHHLYDSLNVFLRRSKAYNPMGRLQDEAGAKDLDQKILDLLIKEKVPFVEVISNRQAPITIMNHMRDRGWDITEHDA